MTPPPAPNGPTDPDESDNRSSTSGGLSDWTEALQDMSPYLHLGWTLAATAAGPPLLGFVVDWWLGTTPWCTLTGGMLGLVTAAVQLKRLQEEFGQ
jgi:hypothetical protein